MSIRAYFENIADAIKNVYGTTDTLTPAEMPQAITNLSSIFQTKELSSPIGTETTVEGCLSSLSSDLSELMNPEYIEITIETGDTYGAILTKLKSLLDISKVNPRTYMTYVNTQFIAYLNGLSPNSWFSFAVCAGSPGGAYNIVLYINVNGTVSVEESKGTTRTDITSNAVPSVWVGSKARIYYK